VSEAGTKGAPLPDDQKNSQSVGGGSKPLVEVKITAANINLAGIEKFKGVLNNMLKAFSRGVGTLYEPIDRVRNARADRLVAIERAQTVIDLTKKDAELADLHKQLGVTESPQGSQSGRALAYLFCELLRKQDNREKVIEAVAVELNGSPPKEDTDAQIDDDWLTQFWNLAENISREEVRAFLARVLAKEASQPGAIGPLTLRVLSTLTPHVAQRFEHFCRLSIREDNDVFVIHPNVFHFQNIGSLDEFNVSYDDLYELESFGLLRSAETIMLNYSNNISDPASINYAGIPATLNFAGLQLHLLKFARPGVELRELLLLSPIPEYTQVLRQKLGAAFVLPEARSPDERSEIRG